MQLEKRVKALEKTVFAVDNEALEDARALVSFEIHFGLVPTDVDIEERVRHYAEQGRGLRRTLDRIDGKTRGLPSERSDFPDAVFEE